MLHDNASNKTEASEIWNGRQKSASFQHPYIMCRGRCTMDNQGQWLFVELYHVIPLDQWNF